MESTYTTEGIVLRRDLWREADCRLVIYTREAGKLDLIARGVKKPSSKLAGHLEPFNRLKLMVINGRSKSYVASAQALDSFYHLKQDLDKLQWAGEWLADFNRLVKDNQVDAKLYALLASSLSVFNSIKAGPIYYRALGSLYLLKLYELMGEGLDWEELSKQANTNQKHLELLKVSLAKLYQGAPKLTKSLAELTIHLALVLKN